MVRRLIEWAVANPLIVILLAVALAAFGGYSFWAVNVEAYPDPAPAIIEVVAQYPGRTAEEVERLVTIPLEVTLSGIRGLKYTRSKSLPGLSHLRNQFDYGVDFYAARQEVINRLQNPEIPLPAGVTPQISPVTPTGELMRYTLSGPEGAYTLNDLKALQDWTLERQFRRLPGIADVVSFGGTVKRYEVRPQPGRLHYYGITLAQLQNAVTNGNANVGGDYLTAGEAVQTVRGVGLVGGGQDPMHARELLGMEAREFRAQVLAARDLSKEQRQRLLAAFRGTPRLNPPLTEAEKSRVDQLRSAARHVAALQAARYLRREDRRRIMNLRELVITATNNVPVSVNDVVEGGALLGDPDEPSDQGVVVSHQTRLGQVGLRYPRTTADGKTEWVDEDDKVMGTVLMRKNEETLPTLKAVKDKVAALNDRPGTLLPGVQIVPHFDLTGLIQITTRTVRENLLSGMGLVTLVLLMFLSNVRSAVIVAINIPLALLFAFAVLFLRGKSANLLSIGAVDFGIIIDSSVIMVENIYRHLSSGEASDLPLSQRIVKASREVERSLFYSTAIMLCAFIPLFTLQGPEGQIFGPMADTYAFALGGALILSLTLSPVLCLLLFRRLKPARDNFLVRWIKALVLRQLQFCLEYRWISLAGVGALGAVTFLFMANLGREFMPELEEGNVYIRGTFPVSVSLGDVADKARRARAIITSYPEVQMVQSQVGRPDDGTDPTGFSNAEFSAPLKPEGEWPARRDTEGWWDRLWSGPRRPYSKDELVDAMKEELNRKIVGVDWAFSQYIRDNVTESLSGVKGDNSIKIIGPDLQELETLAKRVKTRIEDKGPGYAGPDAGVRGVQDVGVFHIMGQSSLTVAADRQKCRLWGVTAADVNTVIESAVGGRALTQMVEGEKQFDITLRWPAKLRASEQDILNIPVDVSNNVVTSGVPTVPGSPTTGPSTGVSALGYSGALPAAYGSVYAGTLNNLPNTPHQSLRDLVTAVDDQGRPDPHGRFVRPGAATIFREQGNRLIAVGFSVRGRDLAGAVAEAQRATADLIQPPYRAEWSGEFQEMQEAEHRLLLVGSLALLLIGVMLYLAFGSMLDAAVVFSNVVAASMGGLWALVFTGTNFNVSAAVGFISILGVAIMNGLLMVSSFNSLRAQGVPLREAITRGVEKLVRPLTMTALAAIFGLLPAALSTRIGSQSQRPLAIAVVGGMIMTLVLANLVPLLYSFYGHREPPQTAGMGH